jgi:hypothetical protein
VAPPDLNAPGFLAPGKSQQEAEQQNDDDTAAPSPGLLASVFDAVTGNPAANNPGNALAAMNAAKSGAVRAGGGQRRGDELAGAFSANLSSMNDVSNALSNPRRSMSRTISRRLQCCRAGHRLGSGQRIYGRPRRARGNSARNQHERERAALMDTVNTDFDAPGFEQDASNNAAQTAISTALDNAATTAISNEADTSSPSAAPTGYSPGDMGFSGLNADTGMGTGVGVVAGPGFGGDVAASSGL